MINRRRFLKYSALGTATVPFGMGGLLNAGPQAQRWNILLITSDEHNPKIMGCAGHPFIKTPAIDRLAREGMMFTRAYCADPICAPTRQSFLTGNYPQEHGQFSNSHVFNEHMRTWGNHFHDHGYVTAAIGKLHNNNERYNFGFDYRNIATGGKAKRRWDPEDKKAYDASPDSRFSGTILDTPERDHDGTVVDDSIRWLKANKDKLFFLHASMVKPHWPWDAPNDFYHMYDPAKIDYPKQIPGDLDDDWAPRKIYQTWHWDRITEQMHRVYRARYYGSLSWLDSNVGRLLDTLDELKLADRTLVLYFTDHGDMASEKGCWLKSVMFDASARVPLIFRMPGVIPAGRKTSEIINHVDLFPTIASLAGVQSGLPSNLSGMDFSQAVLGKGRGREISFSVHGVRGWNVPPQQVMARTDRWKFNWYPQAENERDRYVLYDMQNDPDEITNLAWRPEYKKVVSENQEAIHSFLASLKKPPYDPVRIREQRKHNPGDR